MIDTIDQLRLFLEKLSEAMSNTKVTEVNGIRVEQRMFGKLETIVCGDNSNVTINQNLILAVDNQEILNDAMELLGKLRNIVPSEKLPLQDAVRNYQRGLIEIAVEEADGDQKKAAKLLGLTERQMRYRSAIEFKEEGS